MKRNTLNEQSTASVGNPVALHRSNSQDEVMDYDVFISHASEDEECFVAPLAKELAILGVKVWYDEFSLKLGDSLSRSIDKGLARSRYGIVVISKAFMNKPWPEYELRGLLSKEISRGKVILPIWHNVTKEEVLAFSPSLCDKCALDTAKHDFHQIVFDVLEIVAPKIYNNLIRILTLQRLKREATHQKVKLREIRLGPIRHDTLPMGLLQRIELVYLVLSDVMETPFNEMVDNFKRDLNPRTEISVWETICIKYLREIAGKRLNKKKKQEIFLNHLLRSMGPSK
ncbi:MAG: toll/interleukin-1 receptor domain-containing protein [bacterium]